jgi:hypothetical protein
MSCDFELIILVFTSQSIIRKQRLFIHEYLKEAHLHIAVFVTTLFLTSYVY